MCLSFCNGSNPYRQYQGITQNSRPLAGDIAKLSSYAGDGLTVAARFSGSLAPMVAGTAAGLNGISAFANSVVGYNRGVYKSGLSASVSGVASIFLNTF